MRADLVIGVDSTFDLSSPQVEMVRKQLNGNLCPAVTFVTPYTIEHISKVIQAGSEDDRLRESLTQATHLRKQAGTFTAVESAEPGRIGTQLALLLSGDTKGLSTLPYLPELQQSDMPEPKPSQAIPQQGDISRKRAIEDVSPTSADPIAKKARFEEPPANVHLPGSLDSTTHITDTTAQQPSQTNPSLAQLTSLRAELQATRAAAAAQDTVLSTLTDDHRAQAHTIHTLTAQLARAQSALATSETKRTDLLATLSTTRADLSTARSELASANAALASSTIPSLASYGTVQQRAAQADTLERKLASLQKDFDFTRQQYQSASDSAATLASDLSAAQAEIERLTHAASDQRTVLRNMYVDAAVNRAQESVDKAHAEKAAMERLVRTLEREIADLKEREGRRGMAGSTRASSLPPAQLGAALASLAHGHGRAVTPGLGAGAVVGGLGGGANTVAALGGRVGRADGTASALARSAAVGSRNASPKRAPVSRTASPRRAAAVASGGGGLGAGLSAAAGGSRAGSRQASPVRRAASPAKRGVSPGKDGGGKRK